MNCPSHLTITVHFWTGPLKVYGTKCIIDGIFFPTYTTMGRRVGKGFDFEFFSLCSDVLILSSAQSGDSYFLIRRHMHIYDKNNSALPLSLESKLRIRIRVPTH